MILYSNLSPQSRVWIYQANRLLTNDEVSLILNKVTGFVNGWTAHNRPLKAFAEIRENLFILFYVDESESVISGCGIDKSVHLVQEIGNELNVDFLDRSTVAYISKDKIHFAILNELKNLYNNNSINDGTIVFNNTIQTKSELENTWKIPLSKSWIYKRVFNSNNIKVN